MQGSIRSLQREEACRTAEETFNSSMMNKVSWFAKSFGRMLDCVFYSNGEVCMTWGISRFKSKNGRTFRYPVVSVRDNTEDDCDDTHLYVRFIICGKTVDFYTYYDRPEKVWFVDSVCIDGEEDEELMSEMEFQHGLSYRNLDNMVESIKSTADWIDTEFRKKISAESYESEE